jgi:hypothetical protein
MAIAASACARSEVTRVQVLERSVFAAGMSFGKVGPYEKIRGIARFSLDPNAAANQRIVDLQLARRDEHGRVTFDSAFLMLRPVKSSGTSLLYDVNNRGNIAILGQVNGKIPEHNVPRAWLMQAMAF